MDELTAAETAQASLAEVLDRVLGKGAVIAGDVIISVADIDLVRLSLQLVLGSTDALLELPRVGVTPAPGRPGGGT
ncbi:MAG TPA: gas vesicle protein [Kofleriaceae bacterium]|jgi:hypothetical protein|nr:gas vesicle protein [Kofleriaceae bacterium]